MERNKLSTKKDDWKMSEKNYKIIAPNIPKEEKDGWHYLLAAKKITALLTGIAK